MTPADGPLHDRSERRAMRVLVVDDEEHNRRRLLALLAEEPDIEVVGEAADGVEAVTAIRERRPDLVLLDVQMPGRTGLDVVREIGADRMPATIFVTAYSRYAVDAFDMAAVDYLVKPFDDERFQEALRRARRALASDGIAQLREHLTSLLSASAPAVAKGGGSREVHGTTDGATSGAGPTARYLERIAVDIRGTVRPISVADIEYITADGPYTELHVGGRQYVIRESLQALEERLDPARFLRIHRSIIVRLDLIEALKRGAGGDGEVLLKGGTRLRVSRTRREALERWLGLAS